MPIFYPFNVLIPQRDYLQYWPVIACDQFTSQPDYWDCIRNTVSSTPSSIHCIIPEAELSYATEQTYNDIHETMRGYINSSLFNQYTNSFVYVERVLSNGDVRSGIVGVVDLEDYDYHDHSQSAIRATERTVLERIPPRMRVRRGASFELSHVLLLCDDDKFSIIEPLKAEVTTKLYDLNLLQGGGRITGWLINGDIGEKLMERIDEYCERKEKDLNGMLFAVGDGNHSLASAKEYYEELKRTSRDNEVINRARFAMVELENIRDSVQVFEPIHRLLLDVEANRVLSFLRESCCSKDGYPITWVTGSAEGTIYLSKEKGVLPVGILQTALDNFLKTENGSIDFIHEEENLRFLAQKEKSMGFILPAIPKKRFL